MWDAEYGAALGAVNKALENCFAEDRPHRALREAMRYSLLAGGKRIRPVLVLKFCEGCGGDAEKALPVACGIEMLHTYSLIHDDLPCMDDDELRRGKPTNHVVFGECTATLAGDALQAAAFESVLSAPIPDGRRAAAALELARAAGQDGMCGGQQLDMEGEMKGPTQTLDGVRLVHEKKTAALIRAAAKMGVISGGGSEEQLMAAEAYADAIGIAFQIRDDLLDIYATEAELGKPIGSDKESGKVTFASLLGAEECERIIAEKTEEAKRAVEGKFKNAAFLAELAEKLAVRRY